MRLIICMSALVALSVGNQINSNLFTSANYQLRAKLLAEESKLDPGKSVVLSGFSVLSMLAQLAEASEGQTRDEILKSVGLPHDVLIKDVFADVNRQLRTLTGLELKMANRVYVHKDFELNNDFVATTRDTFSSDFMKIDFSMRNRAIAEINHWVEEQTDKRIKDLLKPDTLQGTSVAVLINAIYLRGTWMNRFSKAQTKVRDFYVSTERTIGVPTMYKNDWFKYGDSSELGAKILELPYSDGESSLMLFLPNEIDGLANLEEKIKNHRNLVAKALNNMTSENVEVYLPKFKIETEINLDDVLTKIGISRLFRPDAQLNKLLRDNIGGLYVTEAIQKAFIEVNEDGTVAAAASDAVISFTVSNSAGYRRSFEANRPFYFTIKVRGHNVFSGHFKM